MSECWQHAICCYELYAAQWLTGQPNSLRDAYSYVDALQSGHDTHSHNFCD